MADKEQKFYESLIFINLIPLFPLIEGAMELCYILMIKGMIMNIVGRINSYFINELDRFDFSNNVYEAFLFEKENLFQLLGIRVTDSNDDDLDNILFDYCHHFAHPDNVDIAQDAKGYWRLRGLDKEYFVKHISQYFL